MTDALPEEPRGIFIAVLLTIGAASLALGLVTDPMPCGAPGQTGCGYDIAHLGLVAVIGAIIVWASPDRWWARNA